MFDARCRLVAAPRPDDLGRVSDSGWGWVGSPRRGGRFGREPPGRLGEPSLPVKRFLPLSILPPPLSRFDTGRRADASKSLRPIENQRYHVQIDCGFCSWGAHAPSRATGRASRPASETADNLDALAPPSPVKGHAQSSVLSVDIFCGFVPRICANSGQIQTLYVWIKKSFQMWNVWI
jgi:hypothetical protein